MSKKDAETPNPPEPSREPQARASVPGAPNQARPNGLQPDPTGPGGQPEQDADLLARDIGNQLDKIRRRVAAAQRFLAKPKSKPEPGKK